MKRMMLAGGLAGFALAMLGGLSSAHVDWPLLLLKASIAALVGGIITRWWAGLVGKCLVEARLEYQTRQETSKMAQASIPLSKKN